MLSQLLEKALLVKAEIDEADPAHFRAAEDAYRRALHDWENFSRCVFSRLWGLMCNTQSFCHFCMMLIATEAAVPKQEAVHETAQD